VAISVHSNAASDSCDSPPAPRHSAVAAVEKRTISQTLPLITLGLDHYFKT